MEVTITKGEEKVWGEVSHLCTENAMTSILQVKAGFRCSNHRHVHRWNRFHVISGIVSVVALGKNIYEGSEFVDDETCEIHAGLWIDIPAGTYHRFEVIESGTIVETYWTTDGTPVDPNDIERLDVGGPIGS